jgi:hypothetical protein
VGLFSLTAFDRAPQVLTSKSRSPREAYDPRHQIWIVETRRQLLALAKRWGKVVTDDEQAADRNDYEEGFRKGLEMAIKVGTRTAQGLVDEYKRGADVVEAIEKVLKDAK